MLNVMNVNFDLRLKSSTQDETKHPITNAMPAVLMYGQAAPQKKVKAVHWQNSANNSKLTGSRTGNGYKLRC